MPWHNLPKSYVSPTTLELYYSQVLRAFKETKGETGLANQYFMAGKGKPGSSKWRRHTNIFNAIAEKAKADYTATARARAEIIATAPTRPASAAPVAAPPKVEFKVHVVPKATRFGSRRDFRSALEAAGFVGNALVSVYAGVGDRWLNTFSNLDKLAVGVVSERTGGIVVEESGSWDKVYGSQTAIRFEQGEQPS
jgi:hypothetical protein